MTPKPQPQTAMDENVIEDAELEKALEDRAVAKGAAAEASKKAKTLDEVCKDKLADHGLEDGTVLRIGRFRISQNAVPSRSVAFETSASSRVSITAEPDEEA